MLGSLKYMVILLAISLIACANTTEPLVTSAPAANASTATVKPPEPTDTPPEPTTTPTLEPTPTSLPKPPATSAAQPAPTDAPELIAQETEEPVSEHEAEQVAEVVEPEFAAEAIHAEWQKLEPTNAGPGPRYEHAMQYNLTSHQVFVFGGRDGNQVFNDVWVLNLDNLTWRQLAVNSPVVPPARFSTIMMVDTAAENLYIATGQLENGNVLADVWQLNLKTETWQDLSSIAGQGPVARYGSAGGNLQDNLVVTHGFGTTRYDDTWLFNATSKQWKNITPTGELPLKRCLLAATLSTTNLVLHGGCSSGFGPCPQEDTWILDTIAQTWHQVLSEIKPVGRQHQSLVNRADQGQVILFGGQDANKAARDDVWLLDVATESWQPIEAAAGPTARYNHQAVWTPLGMLVYGGRNSEPLGDLWLLTFSK